MLPFYMKHSIEFQQKMEGEEKHIWAKKKNRKIFRDHQIQILLMVRGSTVNRGVV